MGDGLFVSDLEVLPPEGMYAGDGVPPEWTDGHVDPGLTLPRQSPTLLRLLAILATVTAAIATGFAVHFRNANGDVAGRLSFVEKTAANLGVLAYDGGGMYTLPSPPGTQVTFTVAFVKVRGAPAESVWVFASATGLDERFGAYQLVAESCDRQVLYRLDPTGATIGGSTVFKAVNLGLPPRGSYVVSLRSWEAIGASGWLDSIGGVSIGSARTVTPVATDSPGC